PCSIGVNLLNTGSTSTGNTNVSSSISTAAPAAPTAHHQRGNSLVTAKKPTSATPPMTAPTANPLSRSTTQAPQVWVDSPYWRSTLCRHAANGSVTSSPTSTTARPPSSACASQCPPNGRPTSSTRRAPSGVSPSTSATTSATTRA